MSKDAKYFDPRNPGWMDDAEIARLKYLCAGKGDVPGKPCLAFCVSCRGRAIFSDW